MLLLLSILACVPVLHSPDSDNNNINTTYSTNHY